MRVNISYSVELEQVLEKVWELYHHEKEKLDDKLKDLDLILNHKFVDEELGGVSKAIQEYRLAMTSFDIKLAEISNILNGYYAIKYAAEVTPNQQETSETEQENE